MHNFANRTRAYVGAATRTTFALVALLVALPSVLPAADLSDPYEILARHYEALGGLDRLDADSAVYTEADFSMGSLKGTVRTWQKDPILKRQELDLTVFQQVSGDNGEYAWQSDVNNKVQIVRDESALVRRQVSLLASDHSFLDRDSEIFRLELIGVESLSDAYVYVVAMANSLNDDTTLTYINTRTLLTEKLTEITPDGRTNTIMSDYRDIGGHLVSFRQEIENLPSGQTFVVQLTRYEANIDIDPTLFEPPAEDVRDFEFALGNSSEDVPFEYIMDHIFIPVNIAGKERLWVLDTGAGMTVVDSTFAAELGLHMEGDLKGQGGGNTLSYSMVTLPPYSLKGIRFDEQTVVAIDLQPLLTKAGLEAVGILGYDFLSRFTIKVDYAARTLSFYDPETFEYTGDGTTLDAPLKNQVLTAPMSVDGKFDGQWRLDLGATGCSIHHPHAKANGLLERKGIDNISLGAGGSSLERTMEFERIDFAGFTVEKPLLDFPVGGDAGTLAEAELIGNIGNTLLKRFVLYLDYASQRLIVEKGADFDRVFPRGKSGLQVLYNADGEMETANVVHGTPADKAGFEVGDVVTGVNGIDIEHLDGLVAFRDLMKEPAGTKYEITVARDGERKVLKMKLRDLF